MNISQLKLRSEKFDDDDDDDNNNDDDDDNNNNNNNNNNTIGYVEAKHSTSDSDSNIIYGSNSKVTITKSKET